MPKAIVTVFRPLSLLFIIWCLLLTPAKSQAQATARQCLEGSLLQVLDVIRNPDYADPVKRAGLRGKIGELARLNFDFLEFSSRTVGQRWHEFSEEQKTSFADAFADLLINTYVNKIDGYNGEQIIFTGDKTSPKGDRTEILTVITMKSGKKIPVAYRMLPKNGRWKVYDVLIENISLVKNYRTQFQDLLKTSSPEELIERIRAKAHEASQHNGKK